MTAYYNEIDPYAAQWLRNLIAAGHIAPGDVDERDIRDVAPDDLKGYKQCHFFAGIGVWSLSLRNAGWDDEREVWTGSCPCQPFSAAGGRGGFDDERHLWPAWLHLIRIRRPEIVFGEQVASKDGLAWDDLVQADMEGEGYARISVDLCAAGVGVPHIRQRLFFVAERLADADDKGPQGRRIGRHGAGERLAGLGSVDGGLADAESERRGEARQGSGRPEKRLGDGGEPERLEQPTGLGREEWRTQPGGRSVDARCASERLADADGTGEECGAGNIAEMPEVSENQCQPEHGSDVPERSGTSHDGRGVGRGNGLPNDGTRPRPAHVDWRDADWLFCRDGKWRPVEPGTFPLAHGATARVGRLRAYGNAIVEPATRAFIEAYREASLLS